MDNSPRQPSRPESPPEKSISAAALTAVIIGAGLLAAALIFFRAPIWEFLVRAYAFLSDRGQIRSFISGFGAGAPLVFIAIQILQVIFAPIPGEATGFIGGYLFGTLKGFVFSSLGLAAGSWINFMIGRFFGMRFVRKLIPKRKLDRMNGFIRRQGVLLLFVLFVFPGFPKDYLCLFLGISALPVKVFLMIAAVGRMPGTFMLSLQGASLYERNYPLLGITAGICIVIFFLIYRYREKIYRWVEKVNGNSPSQR